MIFGINTTSDISKLHFCICHFIATDFCDSCYIGIHLLFEVIVLTVADKFLGWRVKFAYSLAYWSGPSAFPFVSSVAFFFCYFWSYIFDNHRKIISLTNFIVACTFLLCCCCLMFVEDFSDIALFIFCWNQSVVNICQKIALSFPWHFI